MRKFITFHYIFYVAGVVVYQITKSFQKRGSSVVYVTLVLRNVYFHNTSCSMTVLSKMLKTT